MTDTPTDETKTDTPTASAAALSFELVPTGRTHTVNGVLEPIRDESGEPEAEWQLLVEVDGSKIPLLTKPASFVANHQERDRRLAERAKQSG